MAGALFFKAFTLFIRTAAKPLAGEVRHYLVEHPKARPVILELAQKIHQAEVAIVRGAEGRKTKAFVGRLSDEEALDLAGKFLDVPDLRPPGAMYDHCLLQQRLLWRAGEAASFSGGLHKTLRVVGLSVIGWELQRGRRESAAKADREKANMRTVHEELAAEKQASLCL
eukprot:jgi/Astpho2/9595/Aster-x0404